MRWLPRRPRGSDLTRSVDRRGQEVLAESILREHLQRIDAERLTRGQVRLDPVSEQQLVDRVLALSVGLGPVEVLLGDPTVEEIVATRFDLVFRLSLGRDGRAGRRKTLVDRSRDVCMDVAPRSYGRANRTTVQCSVPSAGHAAGRRASACRYPRCLEVRDLRFATQHARQGDACRPRRLGDDPPVVADLFRACMAATEVRLVFSGPTGSGKTTLIRACLGELDPIARVVVIEDTAELDLFDPVLHPNVESWEARLANNEGEGAIGQGAQVEARAALPARLARLRRGS